MEQLSAVVRCEGRGEEEEPLLRRAEEILERYDAPGNLMWVRCGLASVRFHRRDLTQAQKGLSIALRTARSLGDTFAELWSLIVSAQVALAGGDLTSAEEQLTKAEVLGDRIDDAVYAEWRRTQQARVALARDEVTVALDLLAANDPTGQPASASASAINHARRLAVIAAATDRFDVAAALLAVINNHPPIPGEALDPLLIDDIEWASELAAGVPTSGALTSLEEAVRDATSELVGCTAVVNRPPDRIRTESRT